MIQEKQFGTTAAPYGFVEYLPAGYSPSSAKFPLMIFLHGAGEVGNGKDQLNWVRRNGPPMQIDKGKDYPMVILSPQTSVGSWAEDGGAGNSTRLNQFLDWILANYNVDANRVYLTGLSLGGGGTWSYAARHGERLAAIIPICGFEGSSDANAAYIGKNTPAIWAAHAADDGTVQVNYTYYWMGSIAKVYGTMKNDQNPWNVKETTTFYVDPANLKWLSVPGQTYKDALNSPIAPPRMVTYYPSGGHGIWERMYGDSQVYDWLLLQKRTDR